MREQHLADEVYYECGGIKRNAILGPNIGQKVLLPYGAWSLEAMDSHGGWVSTAPDLVHFASAVEGGKLLGDKSLATMFARPPGEAGLNKKGKEPATFYGCGWQVRPSGKGTKNIWHNGLLDGTSTLLVNRGADKLTWAILFNGTAPKTAKAAALIDPLMHAAANKVKDWP